MPFVKDRKKLEELKAHYKKGGLGDVTVKKYLNEVLQRRIKNQFVNEEKYMNKISMKYIKYF